MGVPEFLGLLMMIAMIGVIFIGFPISFTLLFLAFIFGTIGVGPDQTFYLAYLQVWGTMTFNLPFLRALKAAASNAWKA